MAELRRRYKGCRAGARLKERAVDHRRCIKSSIPTVIMGNVNSLQNKINELSTLNNQRIYQVCSLFIFRET